MSSKDFLDRILKAGEKYIGGGSGGVIGHIMVEVGLHRYVAGHEFWSFWKAIPEDSEMDTIGQELSARLQAAGCMDEPAIGIKITIKADVLSRDTPYKSDLVEFVPAWQEDSFNLVRDSIDMNNLPFGKLFYGRVQYKANPYFVKKGEAGKTETDQNGKARFPSIRVPVEIFADEAAAKVAAGGDSSTTVNSQWSDTVRAKYSDPASFASATNINDIHAANEKIKKGELPYPTAPALPEPLTLPNQKQYLAKMFDCEPPDIDLILDKTPF